MPLDPALLEKYNADLRHLDAKSRIAYLARLSRGDLLMSSSFGETSAVLLHLASAVLGDVEVVFVRNGHESSGTLEAQGKLTAALGLRIVTVMAPHLSVPPGGTPEFAEFQARSKSGPFQDYLSRRRPKIWMSGVRRDESARRRSFDYLMCGRHCFSAHPILDWTRMQCIEYCDRYGLATNDFHFDPTKGLEQNLECGLHIDKWRESDQS